MTTISKAFIDCASTAKMSDKIAVLSSVDRTVVDQIFEDTFDQSVTYGVTSHGLSIVGSGKLTVDTSYYRFRSLLLRLANRELTGNRALEQVSDCIASFVQEDQKLLMCILDRNLAVGVTLDGWRKATGRMAVKFEVPLAVHLDKTKGVDPLDGTYYASHKLDGVRLVAMADMDSGKVKFLSRSGKEYHTLSNLEGPVLKVLRGRKGVWVLDGECCHIKEDGSEDFQGIMKQVTRKDYSIPDPRYCVFDLVGLDVFEGRERGPVFSERYKDMLSLPKDDHIVILEQERVTSEDTFHAWEKKVATNDWEGFMLRKDTFFRRGRSKDLLKVKPYMDAEFTVVGIVEGKQVFAVPGKGNQEFAGVKYLVIEPWSGEQVHVGSGLTKEQRIAWLEYPERIVGKTVTVKFLEETVDQDGKRSLRHPTLKYVYEDGRKGM